MIYFYPLYRDYGPVPFTEPCKFNYTVRNDGTGYLKVELHEKPIFEREYVDEQALDNAYDRIISTLYDMAKAGEAGLFDLDFRVFG